MKSGGRGGRRIRTISERYQRQKPRQTDQKGSHGTRKTPWGERLTRWKSLFLSLTYTAASSLRGLRQNTVQLIVTPISL